MTETLFRATLDVAETTGRTLSGLAVPWDKPTRVRDLTGPAYLEAFTPGSADVTMRQHPSFPVFKRHNYNEDPIGVVTFQRSAEGLIFEAPLSKTKAADEALELVNDGAMRSVSVGFRPLKSINRPSTDGTVTWRTEVALRELSLAPSGFGQYPEAMVASVRTEQIETPVLTALQRRRARIQLPI